MGLNGGHASTSGLQEFEFTVDNYDLCFGCVSLGYLEVGARRDFLQRCRTSSAAMLFVESYSDGVTSWTRRPGTPRWTSRICWASSMPCSARTW